MMNAIYSIFSVVTLVLSLFVRSRLRHAYRQVAAVHSDIAEMRTLLTALDRGLARDAEGVRTEDSDLARELDSVQRLTALLAADLAYAGESDRRKGSSLGRAHRRAHELESKLCEVLKESGMARGPGIASRLDEGQTVAARVLTVLGDAGPRNKSGSSRGSVAMTARAVSLATGLLPKASREDYREQFAADLHELAELSRIAQWRYAVSIWLNICKLAWVLRGSKRMSFFRTRRWVDHALGVVLRVIGA